MDQLDPKDQEQIRVFQEQQSQRNMISTATRNLTFLCFPKCVPNPSQGGSSLSSSEQICLKSCVDRFLEANDRIHLDVEAKVKNAS